MAGAKYEAALPKDHSQRSEITEIAEQYLVAASGDARIALVMAVADGVAVTALVSRGFARWGQPTRRKARSG